jgi:quercetin dioxygenase-like cupin family protein
VNDAVSTIYNIYEVFMFGLKSQNGYTQILNGIKIKTICHGENMNMNEFVLQKNTVLPEHNHPNEQIGYLISGKMKLYIGDTNKTLLPGDSWCIQKNIKHKAEILEDSIALEIFSPLRTDYLKYINNADII